MVLMINTKIRDEAELFARICPIGKDKCGTRETFLFHKTLLLDFEEN